MRKTLVVLFALTFMGGLVPSVFAQSGGRIAGTITGGGQPLVNATVWLYDSSGAVVPPAPIRTDSAGKYTSSLLAPGSYYVLASGWSSGRSAALWNNVACGIGCKVVDGTIVVVTDGATTAGIDLDLPAAAQVRVRVRDAVTRQQIPATVRFYAPELYTGTTDVAQLPAGQYWIGIDPHSAAYPMMAWPDVVCNPRTDECPMSGDPIQVTAGQQLELEVFAVSEMGLARGRVIAAGTGQPVPYAQLSWKNSEGKTESFSATADGTYWYPFFAGRYTVRVSGSGWFPAERAVDITASSETVTDFDLQRQPEITGTVRDINGQPQRGVQVQLGTKGSFYTGADGRFAFIELAPGTYSVTAGAGYYSEFQPQTSAPITLGTTGSGTADFTLRRYPVVYGRVTDALTGAPVDRAEVLNNRLGYDGQYRVIVRDGLEVFLAAQPYYNDYVRQAYPSTDCSRCPGAVLKLELDKEVRVDFALHRPSRFTGKVVDGLTGNPLGEIVVTVYERDGTVVGSAKTLADGTYATAKFAGLGEYFAVARRPFTEGEQWFDRVECPLRCEPGTGTAVRGSHGTDVTGIDFSLGAPPGIAAIWFVDANDVPLPGIGVELYSTSGGTILRSSDVSNGSGLVRVTVPSGSYHVKSWNSAGYVDVLGGNIPCGSSCDVTAGTPIVVEPRFAAEMTLQMRKVALGAVVPVSGLVLGGDVVTVRGGGFNTSTRVYLGASEAPILTRSDDTLTVRTPPHASGNVDVAVVNGDGATDVRTAAFSYRETCGRLQATGTRNGTTLELHVTSPDAYEVQWFRGNDLTAAPLRTGGTTFNAPEEEGAYTARVKTSCDGVDVTFTFETTPPPPPTPGRRRAARH
ncbi:MAG TPA: carboxypeptidase regulatory-like domain-containing protein [Thermoanaerobaculia bacterium]